MSRTYMCPNICGFAKVLALEIAKELVESSLKKEGETDKKYQDHLKGDKTNASMIPLVRQMGNLISI